MLKLNIDPRKREIIYNLTGPLVAQWIYSVVSVVGSITSTVGLIKGNDELFWSSVAMTILSSYLCYETNKRFDCVYNKLKNKPSGLEQKLGD